MNRENHYHSDMTPGQLLKLFRSRPRRSAHGKLKQTEVAERLGVDVRAVQQWENNERLPSAANLKKLLRVFVEEGLFLESRDREEAYLLWQTVRQAYENRPGATRLYPPFDDAWFASLYSGPTHRQTNLPSSLTSFIGREQELVEIRQQLASTRLLTLAGAGGCGKTRLAIETARNLLPSYPDGVWFLDLSSIREPAFLPNFIAMTLNIGEAQDQPPLLTRRLRQKQMLLIWDNCEQIIDACASLIENWLQTCPHLHFLATSRETLNIPSERVFFVPLLSLPLASDQGRPSLQAIAASSAVRLFVERARAVQSSFELTPTNAALIAQICERLDGLPLAIELAAARLDLLSEAQLLSRISDPLSLLVGGPRTRRSHQQTLRASLIWSYHLLTAQEQALFARLGLFAGGWTLSALEALVPSATKTPEDEPLYLLSRLVAKSLVTVHRASPGEEPRYHMLETVRAYSLECLQEQCSVPERETLCARHAAYYRQLVEESEGHLRSGQRAPWLRCLQEEYENIRAALSWCVLHKDQAGCGLRIAAALYWFWLHQGFWSEGREWLETLLAVARERKEPELRPICARVVHGAGIIARAQGRRQEAAYLAQESLTLARAAGDPEVLAACLRLSSQIAQDHNDPQQARAYAEESVALARAQGSAWSLATSLNALGIVARLQADYEYACSCYEESISHLRAIGDRWELSAPLRNLGSLMLHLQDDERACALLRESLVYAQEVKGTWFLSRTLEDVAFLLNQRGEAGHAAKVLGAAEALREPLGATVMSFPSDTYQRNLNLLHQHLSQDTFQAFWQSGRTMTSEQVLSFVLEVL